MITWNSVPDYDAWGFDNYWNAQDWQTWYYALKEHFGPGTAGYIWSYAWNLQTMGASPLDARTVSTSFRKFIKDNKLDAYGDGVLPNLIKPVGSAIGAVNDVFSGATSAISGAGKGLKYVLPVAGILVLSMAGFYLYRKLKK